MYNNRSYRRRQRSVTSGLGAAIFFIGLILAFAFGDFNLPIFFTGLAFCALVTSLGTFSAKGVTNGIIGFFWLLMLALFFLTHTWLWFLVGVVISILIGSLYRPILAGLGLLGLAAMTNQQQPYYQPSQQQPYYQPPQQQSYEQGYQPRRQETYREGGQQYQYSSDSPQQYEQAQAEYPEQLPPQQQ